MYAFYILLYFIFYLEKNLFLISFVTNLSGSIQKHKKLIYRQYSLKVEELW